MTQWHRFDCRACGASVAVDGDVMAEVLDSGCPLCDAPAVEDDFEAVPPSER